MYKWRERRTGKCYSGIIDGKNVKLSRLLLVSDRDWRKQPAEAGAEAAEKVARRDLNYFAGVVLNSWVCATAPRAARYSKDSPVLLEISRGLARIGALVFGTHRSKQVAGKAGGGFAFSSTA
jgi:hypothetical protein